MRMTYSQERMWPDLVFEDLSKIVNRLRRTRSIAKSQLYIYVVPSGKPRGVIFLTSRLVRPNRMCRLLRGWMVVDIGLPVLIWPTGIQFGTTRIRNFMGFSAHHLKTMHNIWLGSSSIMINSVGPKVSSGLMDNVALNWSDLKSSLTLSVSVFGNCPRPVRGLFRCML